MSLNNKQLVIFLGPPGSGKGSLSQLCIENFGWKQLSTGALCRKHIDEQTNIGKQIDFSIKSGNLISDDLIVSMVEGWLIHPTKEISNIILDGFPRNVTQARALHNMILTKLTDFSFVIYRLFVADNVVTHRLLSRFICENKECQAVYSTEDSGILPIKVGFCNYCSTKLVKRNDDEESIIINRLKTYRMYENDLLSFYKDKGLLVQEINVEKPLNIVFNTFKEILFGSKI